MRRRKYLAAVGSLAAGGAAMMGTGAFTSVQANRTMTVAVEDDSAAYLKLDDEVDQGQDVYSSYDDGELVIEIDGNSEGSGVNQNALTVIDDVFAIKNQGTQPVEVWVELSEDLSDYVDFYAVAGYDNSTVDGGDVSIVGEGNAFSGAGFGSVGSKLRVGVSIDLRDSDAPDSAANLDGTVTVFADTT